MSDTLKLSDKLFHAKVEGRKDLIRAIELGEREGRSRTQSIKEWVAGLNGGLHHKHLLHIIGQKSVGTWGNYLNAPDTESLRPRHGNRRGQRKVTEEVRKVLLSFALHPNRLRLSQIARLTKKQLQRNHLPCPCSERTFIRWLNDWKSAHYDQWVFAREGSKALNDKCLPFLKRDTELLEVGQVLVADGHTLNFQILHPFTGKPARMTMLLWYDWASRMPAGWEIMPNENIQAVASSMRKAILRMGRIPQVAYLDNGRAFKARIFTNPDIDFEEAGFYGMFARLGTETIFAWKYHAQSKPIERFFETFGELERLLPTYVGTDIASKPAHMMRNEELHRSVHLKRYGGWIPTIEEAQTIIEAWFKEYGARPHEGLKGLCPADVFTSGKGPGVDPDALRYLMMSMEIRTITRNGISFLGRDFYDPALYGLRDRALIRYDLEDLSSVLVYDITGRKLICTAEARQSVHPIARIAGTQDDLALVKEQIRQKRELKKQTESAARAYVMEAPALVQLPETVGRTTQGGGNGKLAKVICLPQGEAEHIEREAARMRVVPMKPKEEPIFTSEIDRFESYLQRECTSNDLSPDEKAFMVYFKKTEAYPRFKDRLDFLKEHFLSEAARGGLSDAKHFC